MHGPHGDAPPAERAPDDEAPPIFGRWSALYALVIGELLLVIAFCGWLSTLGR